MKRIDAYLDDAVSLGGTVDLIAAQGAEPFYRKLGYAPRPDGRPGMVRGQKRTGA